MTCFSSTRNWKRPSLLLALIFALTAAATAALELPSGSQANYFTDSLPRVSPYTFQAGTGYNINNKENPINIIFISGFAAAGDSLNVTHHIENHTGWTGDTGTDQAHSHYGFCRLQSNSRNSGRSCCLGQRSHWRMWPLPYAYTPGAGYYNVLSAHHEHIECGNDQVDPNQPGGASGFDHARDQIASAMSNGGHNTAYQWFGNTENFKTQWCSGDFYAGSSGGGFVIRVDSVQ